MRLAGKIVMFYTFGIFKGADALLLPAFPFLSFWPPFSNPSAPCLPRLAAAGLPQVEQAGVEFAHLTLQVLADSLATLVGTS